MWRIAYKKKVVPLQREKDRHQSNLIHTIKIQRNQQSKFSCIPKIIALLGGFYLPFFYILSIFSAAIPDLGTRFLRYSSVVIIDL